ncbi:hypothetical protein [Vibrio quintilis]|uniref:Uncharacterized protein n=1 Tax=Vibrio quintilis TaxID=1117707 RepID=A0A1M7YP97_9VIBR|nr:hypothetical protein [Vibrio quintilis]SHO54454.1 hypothetical protein VQ7734_00168 [Vibrio quintilis]
MNIYILIIYFFASVLVGYMGRNTFAGAVGYFLLSCIFSPPIALFFLIVTNKKTRIDMNKKNNDL